MKGLLIGIVLVLLFALIGWISFSNDDSTATIQIDKQEIKEDTQEAAQKAEQAAEDAVRETREALDDADEIEIDGREQEEPQPPTTP